MTAEPGFDILFLGHFAVDYNVVDDGIAAARLGARVGVMTRPRRARGRHEVRQKWTPGVPYRLYVPLIVKNS